MISQGLDLSLKQQLKLNQQLMQSMEILSLSNAELEERIKKEGETNPALIVRDRREESISPYNERYVRETDRKESYGDSDYYDDDGKSNWIEAIVSKGETLEEHLLGQLGLMDLDPDVEKTASMIITALDKNGFTGPCPELLVPDSQRQYVPEALDAIQSMDPDGVGAKDWKESVRIQAKANGLRGEEEKLFSEMVETQLETIRSGKLDQAAKALGTDREEVEALFSFLQTLTPYPGQKYNTGYDQYIVPELSIKKDEEGKLVMTVNRDSMPYVEIDQEFRDMAEGLKGSRSKEDKEASKFIKERIASASSLISQLEMRASTIEKTGAVLMERQREFFLKGPLYLKALTMKEVADQIGVHEATISRVASSKYIDTDFGIIPIRSLFSSHVESENSDSLSKDAVKQMILQIIQDNSTGKALSDQKISDILAQKGIKVARRTVGKYRHELDVDSSFSRAK